MSQRAAHLTVQVQCRFTEEQGAALRRYAAEESIGLAESVRGMVGTVLLHLYPEMFGRDELAERLGLADVDTATRRTLPRLKS